MPELPEVETTVRGLAPFLEGHRLEKVETRRNDLRRTFPEDLRQRLQGAKVIEVSRRAKYGLIATERGDTLIFHLGMSGRWRVDPEELEKHDHFLLGTDHGHRLALNDPRRFGSLDIVRSEDLASWPAFVAMGPEPLGEDFTPSYLKSALRGRKAPIKALLLDQRVVAGLGNIYVCEALHMAGIAPGRAGGSISAARLARLVDAIQAVLRSAIEAGGSSLRDYARPDGELGYFSKQFLVYGREGKPCQCGGTVQRRVDSGRSTFYCPRCQR